MHLFRGLCKRIDKITIKAGCCSPASDISTSNKGQQHRTRKREAIPCPGTGDKLTEIGKKLWKAQLRRPPLLQVQEGSGSAFSVERRRESRCYCPIEQSTFAVNSLAQALDPRLKLLITTLLYIRAAYFFMKAMAYPMRFYLRRLPPRYLHVTSDI